MGILRIYPSGFTTNGSCHSYIIPSNREYLPEVGQHGLQDIMDDDNSANCGMTSSDSGCTFRLQTPIT